MAATLGMAAGNFEANDWGMLTHDRDEPDMGDAKLAAASELWKDDASKLRDPILEFGL